MALLKPSGDRDDPSPNIFHIGWGFVPTCLYQPEPLWRCPMTARKNPLRAVTEADKPSPPKSVTEAAARGTTRELLVATRDRIAIAVEDEKTAARDLASLTKRLMETVHDIEAIDARERQEVGHGIEVTDSTFDAAAI